MSDHTVEQHIARIRAATVNRMGRKDLARWIEKNTFMNGKPYSFKHHEWQERVLEEQAPDIVMMKSAQLGASELSLRMAAALIMVMPAPFSIGYVFPSASFSTSYAKTRFNPIIEGSPALKSAVNAADIDNAEVKSFGPNKQLLFRGASSTTAGLSASLDAVFWDEYSFMDQEVASNYVSRTIHSPHKIHIKLSTPTFPGDPIATAFAASKRWRNFCKCHHCGHFFYPSYYEHCRIPGFDGHLDEITSDNLHKYDYQASALHCPSCEQVPDLSPAHREWVCENPGDNYAAVGFQLSPFDVPAVVTVPYLVKVSTSYSSKSRFRNFNLGMAAEDSESGITEEDLNKAAVEGLSTPFNTHVMGIDLGLQSHFMVGSLDSEGRLGVVHYERVPLGRFRERYWALKNEFRVTIVVSDIQPYSDLIQSLSHEDYNLYGASYVTRNGLELFDVKTREADPDSALLGVRQVHVNRNSAFDSLLADFRDQKVWIRKMGDWEVLKAHLQDMKRASATLRNGEFTSQWQKSSKGNDHYHHSLLYLSVAAKMRGVAFSGLLQGLTPVKKIKNRLDNPVKRP